MRGCRTTWDSVGIDDISLYVPRLFLSTTGEFASSRGIEPGKLVKGIGVERMAIPDCHQDAATLAAMAVLDLIRRNQLHPEDISRIYVGTESAVDEAKAIGNYVIGMLERVYGQGSFQGCSTVEFKSACIAASFAMENMSYWLQNNEGEQGIVVASDIARYELGSPGEYTQGAGAVSLLLRPNPRIISLDMLFGTYTGDEDDFFRPVGARTAVVRGKYSNLCYLNAVNEAFREFRSRALRNRLINLGDGECLTDYLDSMLFHIPYPRMVEYSLASLLRQEWRTLPRWTQLEEQIGTEPQSSSSYYRCADITKAQTLIKAGEDFDRTFMKTPQFQEVLRVKAAPSTAISRQVGNIYNGSIYLGLISLLEAGSLNPGQRVSFASYGSGCSAMVFTGMAEPGLAKYRPLKVLEILRQRVELSLSEYEQLHQGELKESILPPSGEFALVKVDDNGYRHYDYI